MSRLYQRKNSGVLGRVVWGLLVFVLTMAMNTRFVYAAFAPGAPGQQPPAGPDAALQDLFGAFYKVGLPASIILGLTLIVINGYGLMTSEGDPRKVQTAQENLTSAIIGLVFVLLAVLTYHIVMNSLFGVGFLNI